ncbi:threonine aldolase family protein [Haliangium ochraceum]|uniref:Threonine aldolase n=1 Tax=Haliangium ochraceum (strain DSM 14365 / JCM 11303 / SMP-2) TaxID=502025 RepID=D0LVA5_HALO1|nr:GntG family PLP-dependent aldolase [Haliangium ochraceum]ACY15946.1 Threonine aldolase [Haliangium ochraceum DSM 14365]
MTTVIDLRSDTVTQPTAEMRRAMAEAVVGDDVYGEDPTVNQLQERVAALLGTEAALFVPSGSMANQIAIKVHTQPGDSVMVGAHAHNWLFEAGGAGAISSVQVDVLPGDGRFDAAAMRESYKPDNHLFAPTRLVSVENTHNMGGGLVWDDEPLAAVLACARELELGTHLDGARLWNAAARTGRSEAELTAGFDTIAVCLSKGLGAPVGSLLCGTRALVHKGHRVRKMLGGGMRQAGILAAAGLYALEHHRPGLTQDHDNAHYLAAELAAVPGFAVDVARVHTNIVMVDVVDSALDAQRIAAAAAERGVRVHGMSPRRMRLVTHRELDRAMCTRAIETLAALAGAPGSASSNAATRAAHG